MAQTPGVTLTISRRLDALENHIVRIERLQKELRVEITILGEGVRVAAAQIRRNARKRGRTPAR